MMGTDIFKIDVSSAEILTKTRVWAEKSTKTRVSFLMNPSVDKISTLFVV